MEQSSFDRIARLLGGAATRRTGLKAALGAALGLGLLTPADTGAKQTGTGKNKGKPGKEGPCGNGSRKANICKKDKDCCTGLCNTKLGKKNRDGKGRCRCVSKGSTCTANRNCCNTLVCTDGACAAPCAPDVCATGCAYTTVQAAITAAADGATIVIGQGTYVEELTIGKNIVLVGCPTATIKDTGAGNRTITIDAGTVELRNLTIDGTGVVATQTDGGGITCKGTLILSGATTVTNGYALGGGGVLLEGEGGMTMKDTARIVNCGGVFGGGVYAATSSTIDMTGSSVVSGNQATKTNEGGGGGVWLGAATMMMSGSSSIKDNTSANWGGGVVLEYNAALSPPLNANLTMTESSTITGNSSTGTNSGGGIWSSNVLNTATGALTRVTGNTPDPQCFDVTCT
jgi:hypothetical protein